MTAPHVGDFVRRVLPLVQRGETANLIAALDRDWSVFKLLPLLRSGDREIVRAALTCLGHVADRSASDAVAACLAHEDEQIVAAAENALWSIWMRAAGPVACEQLAHAVSRLEAEDHHTAVRLLRGLTATHPDFAEAHHQLALAMHSLGLCEPAEASYETAYRLNPHHYAAAANLGHVAVERNDFSAAHRWYKASLRVHPRQPELQAIVPRLAAALDRRVVA